MNYDLIIIGGGAAGFAAAIRASELGAKTLMVNYGLPLGGTCVNVGCVPSKKLIHIAEILSMAKRRIRGVELEVKRFDFSEVMEDEIELVERMREDKYFEVLKNLKVKFIEGRAEFLSDREIRVNGEIFCGERFIICTGSRTAIPPIDGLMEVGFITHIEALRLKRQPKKLLIIGAGPMGLEFGQMFHRFGTEVVILEMMPTIFQPGDKSIVNLLHKYLEREGIVIKTNTRVLKASRDGAKKILTYSINGKEESVSGDEILLATGKIPNTDGLGLDKAGVEIDKKRAIVVNEYLQTSNARIFAAGDVINLPLRLETTAGKEGTIATENALTGSKKSIDYSTVPYTIFTDPSLAGVGLTEEEQMRRFGTCSCRTLKFSDLPKAIIKGRTEGALKLVVHPETLEILGAHLLAPDAGDLIAQAMLILKNKMTVHEVIETLPVFPTFSEAFKLCALSFLRDISKLSCCV